jgi:fermentation-respiration switch protein FrsA (DUF1100 family)
VALAIALAYATLIAIVYLGQDRLLYYPQTGRDATATPASIGLSFETIWIRTEDGETLHGWWIPSDDARGAAIVFHGNAGSISHRIEYAAMFHRLRYGTLLVEYRGYGRSTGSPSEEGTYHDAAAAWRWLVEGKGTRPGDIVLFGESLGGAVAARLAARESPRALILTSTFTSIPDLAAELYRFIPARLLSRYRYDTLEALSRVNAPVLVAHSRADDIIPFSHGERLFAAAREPKQWLELAGGHNDGFIFTRSEWLHAVGVFLDDHAPPNAERERSPAKATKR